MSDVLFSVEAGIARITINRPEQRNALSPAVLTALRQAIRESGENREVRLVTLTGAGERVFCAGADLKASLVQESGPPTQHFGRGAYRQLLLDILRCPKPTVALARGHVMAGGLGILLACDLSLACDDIHFSTPEIQVGMFPMMVIALLYRNVGRKKATELIFLGERISAAAAQECGMVNHVYQRSIFDAQASEFVAKVAAQSGRILGLGKEAIRKVEHLPLSEALEYLESALAQVMASEDSKEGIRAFVEKRKPQWSDE